MKLTEFETCGLLGEHAREILGQETPMLGGTVRIADALPAASADVVRLGA